MFLRKFVQLILLAIVYRGWILQWQGWHEIDKLGHYGGYWVASKNNKKLYAAYPSKQGKLPANYVEFEAQKGQQILCHLETEIEMEPYKAEALARIKKEIDKESHKWDTTK